MNVNERTSYNFTPYYNGVVSPANTSVLTINYKPGSSPRFKEAGRIFLEDEVDLSNRSHPGCYLFLTIKSLTWNED